MEDNSSFTSERLRAIKKKFDIIDEPEEPRITYYTLKQLCTKYNLLQTLELNDTMYLHHQGFKKIENLHYIPGVKVLWLQGNCISTIENLHPCPKLRSLYVSLLFPIRLYSCVFVDVFLIIDNCKTI